MTSAERLAIKFHGYTALTGEYRVGSDGTLSIPVIGRLSIVGVSPADLEKNLAQRVTRLTGRDTYVTVEVIEYRGIFVTGYVARPGVFPWRPGMILMEALALAGGTFRLTGDGTSGLGEDTTIIRLQKSITDQKRHLAALARLEAERENLSDIATPKKLIELVGAARATEVINAERSALTSRRNALEAKRVALARATEMANRELSGLTEQSRRVAIQLSTRQLYKAEIDTLRSKGIVRAERSMDEFTRVADLEDRATTVAVAIARIRGTLAELERDRVNLEYDRLSAIDQDIIKIGREIAQLDIDIEAERMKYRKLTGNEPSLELVSSEPSQQRVLRYKIVRRSSTGTATLNTDEMTELRPADIIYISLE